MQVKGSVDGEVPRRAKRVDVNDDDDLCARSESDAGSRETSAAKKASRISMIC